MFLQGQKLVRAALATESKGSSFVEVLIATVIMSIMVLSLGFALVSLVRGADWVDRTTTATNVARSQMEYVKAQPYNTTYQELGPADLPQDWVGSDDINISIDDVSAGYSQRITVAVSYAGDSYALQGYKVRR